MLVAAVVDIHSSVVHHSEQLELGSLFQSMTVELCRNFRRVYAKFGEVDTNKRGNWSVIDFLIHYSKERGRRIVLCERRNGIGREKTSQTRNNVSIVSIISKLWMQKYIPFRQKKHRQVQRGCIEFHQQMPRHLA